MTHTLHLIQNVLLGVVAVLAALALFTGYVARRVTRAFPPEGRFVDIGGDRIHYVEYGNGPPIVFVHGLAGQLRNFAYLPLARLAQQHRVILIDRPGAGRSLRGAGSQANVFAQARTVAAFIDALQLDKPVLVGHSLGGAIALAVGLNHADRVSRLALIAPLSHEQSEPPAPFAADAAVAAGAPLRVVDLRDSADDPDRPQGRAPGVRAGRRAARLPGQGVDCSGCARTCFTQRRPTCCRRRSTCPRWSAATRTSRCRSTCCTAVPIRS